MNINRRRLLRSTAIGAAAAVASPFVIRDLHADDAIKVAGIHDTSGGLDIYGKQMVATMDLAVNEINAAGGVLGRKIQLINYDPQSNIQLYTQYATEAATKEKVAGGPWRHHLGLARGDPPASASATTRSISTTRSMKAASATATSSAPARPRRRRSRSWCPTCRRSGARRSTPSPPTTITARSPPNGCKKYAQDNGGEVVQTDFFPLDVTDFGPTIKKIQAAKPDLVMSALVGAAHISFYRQWAAAGMNKQIPLASTTFGNEIVITSPEEHNGYIVAFAYLEEHRHAGQQEIRRDACTTSTAIPHMTELATMTYHGVLSVGRTRVKKAGSLDRMKVIEALEQNASFDGPAGKTTIDPQTHHTILDVYIGEAKDKKFVVLEKFSQQKPADTQAVCDLKKNPNENKQYVIDVKT